MTAILILADAFGSPDFNPFGLYFVTFMLDIAILGGVK